MRLSTLSRYASYASAAGALYWGIRSLRTTDRIVSSLFWNNAAILSLGALTLFGPSTRRFKVLQRKGFKKIMLVQGVQGAALAGAAFCLYRARSAIHLEERSRYHNFAGLIAAVPMTYQLNARMIDYSLCAGIAAIAGMVYWMYHVAQTADPMVRSLYSNNLLLFSVGAIIAGDFSKRLASGLGGISELTTLTFSDLIANIKRIKATDWIKAALLAGTVFCLYRSRAAGHLQERLQWDRFATAFIFIPAALSAANGLRDWK
jgi:hypothetical protein